MFDDKNQTNFQNDRIVVNSNFNPSIIHEHYAPVGIFVNALYSAPWMKF